MYIPRGPRKRLLALSELIRLQMKAEEGNVVTAMEVTYPVAMSPFYALARLGLFEGVWKNSSSGGGVVLTTTENTVMLAVVVVWDVFPGSRSAHFSVLDLEH